MSNSLDNFPVSADRAFVHPVLTVVAVTRGGTPVPQRHEGQSFFSTGRATQHHRFLPLCASL